MSAPRQWELVDPGRPTPMNEYRTLHWRARAKYDAAVRERFGWWARQARVPRLARIGVTAVQTCRQLPLPDIGACFPDVKAAVDGLVDVGVIPDDCAPFLAGLTFVPPALGERDALVLIIDEYLEEPAA